MTRRKDLEEARAELRRNWTLMCQEWRAAGRAWKRVILATEAALNRALDRFIEFLSGR